MNSLFPIAFFSFYTSPLVRLFIYFQESMRCSICEQTLLMLPVGGPGDNEHAYLKWISIPASQWILWKNCSWKRPDEGIYKCDHKSPPWSPFQPNLLHLRNDVLPCFCNHFAIISSLYAFNERDSFYFEHLSQISVNLISHHFPRSWHCKAVPKERQIMWFNIYSGVTNAI